MYLLCPPFFLVFLPVSPVCISSCLSSLPACLFHYVPAITSFYLVFLSFPSICLHVHPNSLSRCVFLLVSFYASCQSAFASLCLSQPASLDTCFHSFQIASLSVFLFISVFVHFSYSPLIQFASIHYIFLSLPSFAWFRLLMHPNTLYFCLFPWFYFSYYAPSSPLNPASAFEYIGLICFFSLPLCGFHFI